ncbi:MAG: gliding motility-associated C-terminal domain-containing protein, partial [Dolichospermum sp.]
SSSTQLSLDSAGNVTTQGQMAAGNYELIYQICEKLNPSNCTTAKVTIEIMDITPPSISQLPAESVISCSLTPNFTVPTATDNCSLVTLTFRDETVQGNCSSSFVITRTWTATDAAGNSSTASQVIRVQDTNGPTTNTSYPVTLNATCGSIPAKPELIFVDNCSGVLPAVYTETITNNSTISYTIIRRWDVSDTCGNVTTFNQTITVSTIENVIEINTSACTGESTTLNLFDRLPAGTAVNGSWVDVNNTNALQGNILNPSGLSLGDKVFEYTVTNGSCQTIYRVIVNINDSCIVLGCGNVLVRNAFSPNGDGINETFVIDNINDSCYTENKVEIYNRWGVLVFETRDYNNETNNFDGTSRGRTTIKESTGLPTGTYFYIITYKSTDANRVENKKLEGYLYLSR